MMGWYISTMNLKNIITVSKMVLAADASGWNLHMDLPHLPSCKDQTICHQDGASSGPLSWIDKMRKAHQCHLCPYKTDRSNNLIKHIRIHTREKPYKCGVCSGAFSQQQHLTDHMRVHTGERPFSCNFCPNSYRRKYNLNNHIRRRHSQRAARLAGPSVSA